MRPLSGQALTRLALAVNREPGVLAGGRTRAQAALATRRGRLDVLVAGGKTSGSTFARVAVEHQQALLRAEQTAAAATAARAAVERNQARTAKLEQQLAEGAARQAHLEAQRTIRQLDVAQDKILTATKLTATQLIAFALRVYLTALPMTPETFVSRVFSMRGRKEIEPALERIVFHENPRDPEVNAALHDACRRLNQRNLQRDGRRLRYAVECMPSSPRLSPAGSLDLIPEVPPGPKSLTEPRGHPAQGGAMRSLSNCSVF